MKVSELIQSLSKCDPDAQARLAVTYHLSHVSDPKKVTDFELVGFITSVDVNAEGAVYVHGEREQ